MSIFIVLPLLFLPGYFFTLLCRWISGFYKRLAFSITTSLALEIIISFIIAFLNLPLAVFFLPTIIVLTLIFGLITKRKSLVIFEEWKHLSKREKYFLGIIFVLALAAGAFIFYPHFGYRWPIHVDEWWDISAVQSLLTGRPLNTNPYLFTPYSDYKPGFTSFLANISAVLGKDPVHFWPYLPAFNLFLISFVTSLLLFAGTKNFWIAGLAPIFLAALRSNAYVLGWWFFVPSSFAFIFVVFLLITATDLFKSWSGLFLAFIFSLALGLVYLPFLGLIILSFIPFGARLFKKFPVMFFLVLFSGIVSIVALLALSPYKSFWSSGEPAMLKAFFVPSQATIHFFNFLSFFTVVPFIIFILGLIGGLVLIFKKENWSLALISGGIVGLLNLIIFYLYHISFLSFYQREYYFFGVILALLASISVGKFLATRFKTIISLIFVITVLITIFYGYFNLPSGTLLYHLVNPNDLAALQWLKNQSDLKGKYVLSNADVGTIITPLSGLPAKISWLTTQGTAALKNPKNLSFFNTSDCAVKKSIIIDLNTEIIYGRSPQDCSFLKEIYNKNNVFIYHYLNML